NAGVGALELDRENPFVADQEHPEYRHQRQHRDQRDDGGGESGLAEFADQVGIGKLQGNERYAGGAVGEHAGRPDHQHGVPERGVFVLARDQPVARREGQLHRIREADHHDQRRHHVQEHVEVEIGPSEDAERQHDRDDRRERGDDHERYLAEEDDRDDAAGQNTEDVVGQPVALDRVADFELHDGNARQLSLQPAVRKVFGHQLANIADYLAELVAGDDLGFERQHDQRQGAVFGQQLAADDLVGFDGLDELVVVGALRQIRRK